MQKHVAWLVALKDISESSASVLSIDQYGKYFTVNYDFGFTMNKAYYLGVVRVQRSVLCKYLIKSGENGAVMQFVDSEIRFSYPNPAWKPSTYGPSEPEVLWGTEQGEQQILQSETQNEDRLLYCPDDIRKP